jgi:hypothetical protein
VGPSNIRQKSEFHWILPICVALRANGGNSLDLFANETLYQLSYDPNIFFDSNWKGFQRELNRAMEQEQREMFIADFSAPRG